MKNGNYTGLGDFSNLFGGVTSVRLLFWPGLCLLKAVCKTRRGTMIYFTYKMRRPPRINFRATDIVIYYNYINDFQKPP